jgi:proton-coupled amino acid transporter
MGFVQTGQSPANMSARIRFFADIMNVLKSFIGSNFLVMPFAFKHSGLILGGFMLVAIAMLTDRCCTILVESKHRAVQRMVQRSEGETEDLQKIIHYGETAKEAFGPRAENLVNAALAFTQLGFTIEYFIFVVNALVYFYPDTSKLTLSAVPFAFLMPCALLPSVSALSPVSAAANAALLLGFISILAHELQDPSELDSSDVPLVDWSSSPLFFSITMASFEAIGTVLPVEASLLSGSGNYKLLLHSVVAFTCVFLGGFGTIGLLRFGADGVEQIATDNLPEGLLSEVVRGCLLVAILCTYPLQIFPVIQVAEHFFLESLGDNEVESTLTSRTEGAVLSPNSSAVVPSSQSPLIPEESSNNPLVESSTSENIDAQLPTVDLNGSDGTYGGVAGQDEVGANDTAPKKLYSLACLGSWGRSFIRVCGLTAHSLNGLPVDRESNTEANVSKDLTSSPELHRGELAFDAVELYGPVAGQHLHAACVLRLFIVMFTAVIGLVASNYYGYVAGVVGALGSTFLSFIMPCILHSYLFHGELSWMSRFADIATATIGILGGGIGLAVTIQSWVDDAS